MFYRSTIWLLPALRVLAYRVEQTGDTQWRGYSSVVQSCGWVNTKVLTVVHFLETVLKVSIFKQLFFTIQNKLGFRDIFLTGVSGAIIVRP